MSGPTRIAATLLLALTAFGVGRMTVPEPPEPEPVIEAPEVQLFAERAEWRDAFDAVRSAPGADDLRTRSHEALNTAESDFVLVDAIEMLGWTGAPGDEEWLRSIALSDDEALRGPAIEALGRLGTPAAVDALIAIEAQDERSGEALYALGATGDPRAFAVLERRLQETDLAVPAANALARYGSDAAAQRVTDALRVSHPRNVPGLALAMARFPGEDAREVLYTELQEGSRIHRDAALGALATVGDPMVFDLLLGDLLDGVPRRRTQAAWHLGNLGDPRAVPYLADAALHGGRDLQSAAVGALGQIESRSARTRILDLIETGPEHVAQQAVWNLDDVQEADAVEVLTLSWRRRSWNVRSAITSTLFRAGWKRGEVPPEVLALARAEMTDLPPHGNTQAPAFLLEHGTADDIATVEAMLRDGPTNGRMRVVQALADWPGPAADRLLFESASDLDPNVADSAIRALLNRGVRPSRLEGPLLERLDAPNQLGRIEQLLVELGTPAALDAVRNRLETGTRRERSAAIQALSWSGGSEALDALRSSATQADDEGLKREIYQSLMWSPSGQDPELVQEMLDQDDPSIRSIAVQALSQSGPDGRRQLLALSDDADSQIRREALNALGNVGGVEAEARLIEALEDPELGSTAISGLASMGTASSREALLDAAQTHPDTTTRTSALHQLAWTATPGSADVLTDALYDDDDQVRQAALSSLESLGNSTAAEAIASLLDSDDEQQAQQAAYALERMGGPMAANNRARIEDLTQVTDTGEEFPADIDEMYLEF